LNVNRNATKAFGSVAGGPDAQPEIKDVESSNAAEGIIRMIRI